MEEAQNAIKLFLNSLGANISQKDLNQTPKRIVEGYKNILFGYQIDATNIINNKFSDANNNEIIAFDEIEFFSMCEHHFMPFFGKVKIAYIPNKLAIGFGTVVNLVEAVTRKLQLQEKIANQIALIMQQSPLNPLGVFVCIEGNHFCTLSKNPRFSKPTLVKNIHTTGDFKKQENIQKLNFILKA